MSRFFSYLGFSMTTVRNKCRKDKTLPSRSIHSPNHSVKNTSSFIIAFLFLYSTQKVERAVLLRGDHHLCCAFGVRRVYRLFQHHFVKPVLLKPARHRTRPVWRRVNWLRVGPGHFNPRVCKIDSTRVSIPHETKRWQPSEEIQPYTCSKRRLSLLF